MDPSPILSLQDLQTYFFTAGGVAKAVDGVSLDLQEGETLGMVGESGSGKTVACLSVLQLVPPPGRIVGGKIWFENRNLLELPDAERRRIRGKEIGMVFQDPMTSLNPFLPIGDQVAEPLQIHERFAQRGKMPANDYRVCAPKRHCVSFAALPRAAAIFASWGT